MLQSFKRNNFLLRRISYSLNSSIFFSSSSLKNPSFSSSSSSVLFRSFSSSSSSSSVLFRSFSSDSKSDPSHDEFYFTWRSFGFIAACNSSSSSSLSFLTSTSSFLLFFFSFFLRFWYRCGLLSNSKRYSKKRRSFLQRDLSFLYFLSYSLFLNYLALNKVEHVGKPALGGPFVLFDQNGTPVTDATYRYFTLIFIFFFYL